ncbi:hypothetical protein [Streptomyces rubiginosohelvolus]|uniref:Uncharacterized protein n=1 Tax=Streptomyces rubiginosohelvolus TaxID=67362 RepID=A0ABQ3CBL2_9ACTN|nr:hypothetical protein [Streptomyces pluricolorescens]GGZ83915.1 hypothetical protein GCM10010328_67570 [Streptomyces pluricolorescens]
MAVTPSVLSDSATMLDTRLFPGTRLVYAVLLAKAAGSEGNEVPEEKLLQEVPELVGLAVEEEATLLMMMEELVEYGVLSRIEHVQREGAQRTAVWRVHASALPAGHLRRVCRPCVECGGCACAELHRIPFADQVDAQCGPCKKLAAR